MGVLAPHKTAQQLRNALGKGGLDEPADIASFPTQHTSSHHMAVAAACFSTKDAALFQTLTETCPATPAAPEPDGGDRISPTDRQAVDAALTRLDEIGEAKVKGPTLAQSLFCFSHGVPMPWLCFIIHAAAVSPASAPPTITSPPPPLLPHPSRRLCRRRTARWRTPWCLATTWWTMSVRGPRR